MKVNNNSNNKKSSKKKRNILFGLISIKASFNNTLISISDIKGDVVSWSSSGKMGFKGSKKSTPYAAQVAMNDAIEKAKEYGLQTAKVQIVGAGVGRESALRILQGSNVVIMSIEDMTYLPHNGCRPPKRRRV
jgi:small subunit ribosomal protein S11